MALNSSARNYITFTDDELLRPFLYNKIHDIPLPNSLDILDCDLFGTTKNPWQIWDEFEASHSYCGKDLYVFSVLRKRSATSTRVVRTIGFGTWEGEDTGKSIFAKNTNQLLGMKKRYRFEKSDTYQDGGWILHEYILDKSLITNPSAKNYVLCRFRKNLKLGQQNTGTKIYQQPNSLITNSSSSVVQRKNTRMNNGGQDRSQRKTVAVPPRVPATTTSVPPRAAATTTSGNITLLRKYIIYEEPIKESNTTNVVNTNTNSQSKEETIIIGLEAIGNSENNSGNNKTEAVKITNETKREFNKEQHVECTMNKEYDDDIIMINDDDDDDDPIMSKEEEGGVTMSWPEFFSQELLKKNEGCLIEEEDVPMLSNDFYNDLLFEKYH